jgi:hypothetical protein
MRFWVVVDRLVCRNYLDVDIRNYPLEGIIGVFTLLKNYTKVRYYQYTSKINTPY